MKIILIAVGKTAMDGISAGIDKYADRIRRYIGFEIQCIADIKNAGNMPVMMLCGKEGEKLLNQLKNYNEFYLLDERGKEYSSAEFAGFIEKEMIRGVKTLVFVVGGAYGCSPDVRKKASGKISLSRMTFPHDIIRLIFTEQLYRALTILRGESYHHE
ncbi:MAG: 23S rRNA (pseudouridine(1915)-N(3))-methyltransferase RlmH [Bacteroidota bacterium]